MAAPAAEAGTFFGEARAGTVAVAGAGRAGPEAAEGSCTDCLMTGTSAGGLLGMVRTTGDERETLVVTLVANEVMAEDTRDVLAAAAAADPGGPLAMGTRWGLGMVTVPLMGAAWSGRTEEAVDGVLPEPATGVLTADDNGVLEPDGMAPRVVGTRWEPESAAGCGAAALASDVGVAAAEDGSADVFDGGGYLYSMICKMYASAVGLAVQ